MLCNTVHPWEDWRLRKNWFAFPCVSEYKVSEYNRLLTQFREADVAAHAKAFEFGPADPSDTGFGAHSPEPDG
jgi:hypothetical protein